MVARADLLAKLGRPVGNVPLKPRGADMSQAEHGNNTDIFGEDFIVNMHLILAGSQHEGQTLLGEEIDGTAEEISLLEDHVHVVDLREALVNATA